MIRAAYSRREFIKAMALGSAALALPGCKAAPYVPSIGIQLYTVRRALEQDFEATIGKIAAIGYIGVETYFLPEQISLQRASRAIKDAGLKVLGCHCNLPIGDEWGKTLKMAEAYDARQMVFHGWPQDDSYKNQDALKHTVDVYNGISAALQAEGLQFGLHNHWWEFEKNDDGVYPFYALLENLSPDIFFEIDTYWAKTAGQNPVTVITDFGQRAHFLHIKDGPAQKDELMYKHVPAGEGTVDFPGIVKAGGKNIRWMIVEFDEYELDIFEGVRRSYDYLTEKNLAKGRV